MSDYKRDVELEDRLELENRAFFDGFFADLERPVLGIRWGSSFSSRLERRRAAMDARSKRLLRSGEHYASRAFIRLVAFVSCSDEYTVRYARRRARQAPKAVGAGFEVPPGWIHWARKAIALGWVGSPR